MYEFYKEKFYDKLECLGNYEHMKKFNDSDQIEGFKNALELHKKEYSSLLQKLKFTKQQYSIQGFYKPFHLLSYNKDKVTDIFKFKGSIEREKNWPSTREVLLWQIAVLMVIAYKTDIKIHLVLGEDIRPSGFIADLCKESKRIILGPASISEKDKQNNFVIYFSCKERKGDAGHIKRLQNNGAIVKFIKKDDNKNIKKSINSRLELPSGWNNNNNDNNDEKYDNDIRNNFIDKTVNINSKYNPKYNPKYPSSGFEVQSDWENNDDDICNNLDYKKHESINSKQELGYVPELELQNDSNDDDNDEKYDNEPMPEYFKFYRDPYREKMDIPLNQGLVKIPHDYYKFFYSKLKQLINYKTIGLTMKHEREQIDYFKKTLELHGGKHESLLKKLEYTKQQYSIQGFHKPFDLLCYNKEGKVTDIFEFKSNAEYSAKGGDKLSFQLAVLMVIAYQIDIKIHLVLDNSSPEGFMEVWEGAKKKSLPDTYKKGKENNFVIYFYCKESERKALTKHIKRLEDNGATVEFIAKDQ